MDERSLVGQNETWYRDEWVASSPNVITEPENSSIRWSKVGEQCTNRQTLVMNEGRSRDRSGFRKPSANPASGMTPVSGRRAHHPIAVRAQHLPFDIVDLLQIGVVTDILDLHGSRHYLVSTGHDDDGSKLRSIGDVQSANGHNTSFGFDLVAQLEGKGAYDLEPNSGKPQRGSCADEAS